MALRLALDPSLTWKAPFVLFTLAILLSARFGGKGPGLIATFLSIVAGAFVEPRFIISMADSRNVINLMIFVVVGVSISVICNQLRVSREISRQEAERLRRISDTVPQFLWTATPDGVCDFMNARCFEYCGNAAAQSGIQAGTPKGDAGWEEFVHPEDQGALAKFWAKARLTEGDCTGEFRIRRRDGVYHWFETRVVSARDANGNILKWYGSNTDIQDAHEARETARYERERFERIVATAPGAICQFVVRPDGSTFMPFVSPALQDIFGIDLATLRENARPILTRVHPDDVPGLQRDMAESMRNLAPWRSEYRFAHPERGEIWVECHTVPRRVDDGSTIWHGFIWEITERKIAEEASRRRSEQELRILQTLVENAPMGIAMFDRDMRAVQVSQKWAEDQGRPREEMLGRSHYETFPNLPRRWREMHLRGLAGETLFGKKENYTTPDGREHWINWKIAPWGDAGRRTGGIVIYSEDITAQHRAEQALAASEARYRGLFEHMNQGVAYCEMIIGDDKSGNDFIYRAVNPQFEALTKVSGIIGRRVTEVFPGIRESDPQLLRTYARVTSTRRAERFERFVNALGKWVSVSAYSPEPGFFVAVIDDIDQKKRAELEALQWQSAFEQSESGIALANPVTGKIKAVNLAYSRRLGYTPEELAGQSITALYPEEELQHRAAALQTADTEAGHALFETRHVCKDGTSFPVLMDITTVRDDLGTAISHVKIIHDLTELRRTSEALRTSEATARSLFENASQGILTADGLGRIVDANATVERLFGYERGELKGLEVDALLPESLRDRHAAHRKNFLRQPRGRPMERSLHLAGRRKDGSEFPVEVSLSYIRHGDRSGLTMAFVSDITARKQASEEREELIFRLESALSEKTVLIKEVHHRVKNNLAVIAGLLSLQSDAIEDERATVALNESQRRVMSMALIHEYLYATEHLDRVNFGRYVEQLSNELSASYAIESDLVAVRVEAEEIDLPVHRAIPCGLILNELLSNALKYAFRDGRSGEIVVRFARLDAETLILSCSDDGVGIPETFDWQNSKSLGLRIIAILAKQVDGKLTLDRTQGGARFELRFPVRRQ